MNSTDLAPRNSTTNSAQSRPDLAATIHPNDSKRIIRALEIMETAGPDHKRSWTPGKQFKKNGSSHARYSLSITHATILNSRINQRVEAMFESGILEETEAAEKQYGIGTTAAQAAGYKESLAYHPGGNQQSRKPSRKPNNAPVNWQNVNALGFGVFSDAVWLSA